MYKNDIKCTESKKNNEKTSILTVASQILLTKATALCLRKKFNLGGNIMKSIHLIRKFLMITFVLLLLPASILVAQTTDKKSLEKRTQVKKSSDIPNTEAPVTFIGLIEIPVKDIDKYVADWNEQSKVIGQKPGFISATLYRSLLAGAKYQIINITQWQSYDAWMAANSNLNIKVTGDLYRPAAWSNNIYAGSFQTGKQPSADKGTPLQRVQKDPEIKYPENPFVFINLMEMNAEDVSPFVLDWRVRSKVMGQMPAAIGSTLYRAVLSDSHFQIVNVSQWQSYNGFVDANNDPTYAQELNSDLSHTPSIKLTRGFYRPVASYTHIYTDVPK